METPNTSDSERRGLHAGLNDDRNAAERLGISDCCKATIDLHARNNPMMVCSRCKQLIKCFSEESSFGNYRRFCLSRHRKITTDIYHGWKVIVFRSYDTFTP